MENDEFLQSLADRGAIVKRAKSGKLHTLDVRPIAKQVKPEEISSIGRLRDLRCLELDGCPVDDEAASTFSQLEKLRHLDLQNTLITDASLDLFRQLSKLQFLLLTGSNVSRDGIESLRKNLIGTRIVYL